MQSEKPARRRKWIRWILLAVLLLALLAAFAVRQRGRAGFQERVQALELRGEPTLLAEMEQPPPSEEAARLVAELVQGSIAGEVRLRPRLREGDSVEEAELLLAMAEAARESDARGYEAAVEWAAGEILTRADPPAAAWTLVESWLGEIEGELQRVERIASLGPFRIAVSYDFLDPAAGQLGIDEAEVLIEATAWLSIAAVDDAQRGRFPAALRRMELAWLWVGALRREPFMGPFHAHGMQLEIALNGLQQLLARLPAGYRVQTLQERVGESPPLEALRRAVDGHRCLHLELYRAGEIAWAQADPDSTFVGRTLYPLLAGWDGQRFLEIGERAVALLEREPHQALRGSRELAVELRSPGRWTPVASRIWRVLPGNVETALYHEALRSLAEVGLVDYRDGREIALDWARGLRDPGTGGSIQVREEPDGSVRLGFGMSDAIESREETLWILPAR